MLQIYNIKPKSPERLRRAHERKDDGTRGIESASRENTNYIVFRKCNTLNLLCIAWFAWFYHILEAALYFTLETGETTGITLI